LTAEHSEVLTQVVAPIEAEPTRSADHVRLDYDPITDLHPRDSWTDGLNYTDHFMARAVGKTDEWMLTRGGVNV
jgi:hypothetical protein